MKGSKEHYLLGLNTTCEEIIFRPDVHVVQFPFKGRQACSSPKDHFWIQSPQTLTPTATPGARRGRMGEGTVSAWIWTCRLPSGAPWLCSYTTSLWVCLVLALLLPGLSCSGMCITGSLTLMWLCLAFSPALLPGFSCSCVCITGNITLSLIWVCLVLALLSYQVLAAVACVSQAT